MGLKVYIASPYTKGDVARNVRDAIWAGEYLGRKGHIPFVPHLTHFWHIIYPHDWEEWLKYDFEWLKVCDALIRVGGESNGADWEVDKAHELGIPVYYSIREFLEKQQNAK